jgi:hypothetical protein
MHQKGGLGHAPMRIGTQREPAGVEGSRSESKQVHRDVTPVAVGRVLSVHR